MAPQTAEAVAPVNAPALNVLAAPAKSVGTQSNMPAAFPASVEKLPVQVVAPTVWQRAAPWLVVGYGLGVLLMLVRLVRAWVSSNRLGSRAEKIVDGPLVETLRSLARRWSMRVVPMLAETQEMVVPKVVGLARPMILLPTAAIAGLPPDEIEMILAHELAHVRRHDMWVNLLQRLAEVVLFFNPALWVLSRRISTLREYCCDEMTCQLMAHAASKTGSKTESRNDHEPQLRYATALLHVAELAQPNAADPSDLAALAATGRSPSELRRRVARLFGEPMREPVRVTRGGFFTLVAIVLLIAFGPAIWRTEAQTAGDKVETSGQEIDAPQAPATISGKIALEDHSLEAIPKGTKIPGHILLIARLEESEKAGREFPYGMISVEPNTGAWTKLFDLPSGAGPPTVSHEGKRTFFRYFTRQRGGALMLATNGKREPQHISDRSGMISFGSKGNKVIISHRDLLSLLKPEEEAEKPDADEDTFTLAFHPAPAGHWLIDLAEGTEKALDIPTKYQIEDWSPDGMWLVATSWLSEKEFFGDLYLMRPDGSGRRKLTNHGGGCNEPRFSSDGKQVAYCRSSQGVVRGTRRASVRVIDLATQADHEVLHYENAIENETISLPYEWYYMPAWSPDNKWLAIAYVRRPKGSDVKNREEGLLLLSTDGSQQKKLKLQEGAALKYGPRPPYWQ